MKRLILGLLLAVGLPSEAFGDYAGEVLKDAPAAYWRLADADGARIADASGGHHGGIDGRQASIEFRQPSLLPSDPGNSSVKFNGRDRLVVPGFDKISNDGYTVEYWIKIDQLPDGFLNVVGDGTGASTFFMMNYIYASGRVRAHFGYANSPIAIDSSTPLVPGFTYHVAATWDPTRGTGNLYINGKLNRSVAVTRNQDSINESNDVFIGRDNREDRDARYWLDEVAIYDYALAADRIAAHWAASGAADQHGDDVLRRRQSALDRLNLYRTQGGLPPVRLNAAASKDAAAHAKYLVLNGLIEHAEDPRLPGFTPEGDRAGRGSNISPGLSTEAIDILYAVPYHRTLMIHPMLTEVGIGDDINLDTGFTALALYFYEFDGSVPSKDTLVLSPPPFSQGNGVAPLTGERPSPLPDFGPSYGYPIMAHFYSAYGTPVHFDSRISVKGRDLPHQVVAANRPSNPGSEQRLITLIPDDPLPNNADVSVNLSYLLYNEPRKVSWHFSTGNSRRFDPVAAAGAAEEPRRHLGQLENPTDGSDQSGIGLISGWKCEAQQIVAEIDGIHRVPVAYGSNRSDTVAVCGDANNGFSVLLNWASLGGGVHYVRLLADGKQFGDAKIEVQAFKERFVRGVTRSVILEGFPAPGQNTPLHWSQSVQNFRLGSGPQASESAWGSSQATSASGFLESPTDNGFASGIATIHGWTCAPGVVRIQVDGKELGIAPSGMPRADTSSVCGSDKTGFAYLYNWSLLSPGLHTVAAYVGDQLIAANRVFVTKPGKVTTPFLRGIKARYAITDFPFPGRSLVIEWKESQQNFVVIGQYDGDVAPRFYYDPADSRLLEAASSNGEPLVWHARRGDDGAVSALESVVVGAGQLGVPSDMLTYDASGRPQRFHSRSGVTVAFEYSSSGVVVKEIRAGRNAVTSGARADRGEEDVQDSAAVTRVINSDVTFIDTCPQGASTPLGEMSVQVSYRPVNAFCGSIGAPATNGGGGNYAFAIPVSPGRAEFEIEGLKRAACQSTKDILEFACAGGEPINDLRQQLLNSCPSLGVPAAVNVCRAAIAVWEATCQLDELCSKAVPLIEAAVGTCAGSGAYLDAVGRFPKYGAVGDTLWLTNGVDSAPPRFAWKVRSCKGSIPCAADERICLARDQKRCARWECDKTGQFGDAEGCWQRTVQCPPGKACHESATQGAQSEGLGANDGVDLDGLSRLQIVSTSSVGDELENPRASGSGELCE